MLLRTAAAFGLIAMGAAASTDLKTLALINAPSHLKPRTAGTVTHGTLTMNKSDVPNNAPAHFPWSSPEDFFRNSGLSYADMSRAGIQKCTSQSPNSQVYNVYDGQEERCFVVVAPSSSNKSVPVRRSGQRAERIEDEVVIRSCWNRRNAEDEWVVLLILFSAHVR